MASKQTCIVVYNKIIINQDKTLNKIYINLCKPHYQTLFLKKIYAIYFFNIKT